METVTTTILSRKNDRADSVLRAWPCAQSIPYFASMFVKLLLTATVVHIITCHYYRLRPFFLFVPIVVVVSSSSSSSPFSPFHHMSPAHMAMPWRRNEPVKIRTASRHSKEPAHTFSISLSFPAPFWQTRYVRSPDPASFLKRPERLLYQDDYVVPAKGGTFSYFQSPVVATQYACTTHFSCHCSRPCMGSRAAPMTLK